MFHMWNRSVQKCPKETLPLYPRLASRIPFTFLARASDNIVWIWRVLQYYLPQKSLANFWLPHAKHWTHHAFKTSLELCIHLTPRSHRPPLQTRICNMQEVDTWSWQTFIQSSTIESFTNLPAINNLSKCNLAMFKVRYRGGLILNDGAFVTRNRKIQSLLAWDPQYESSYSLTLDIRKWLLQGSLNNLTNNFKQKTMDFPHEIYQYRLSVASLVKSLISKVERLSVQRTWVNKHVEKIPTNEKAHFFKLSASQLSSLFLTNVYKVNFFSFEHPRSSKLGDTYHEEHDIHGNIVWGCLLYVESIPIARS